jgi:hypothetical protein
MSMHTNEQSKDEVTRRGENGRRKGNSGIINVSRLRERALLRSTGDRQYHM